MHTMHTILYLQATLVDLHSNNYGLIMVTINKTRLYVAIFTFDIFHQKTQTSQNLRYCKQQVVKGSLHQLHGLLALVDESTKGHLLISI